MIAVVLRKMTSGDFSVPKRHASVLLCTNPDPCTMTEVPPATDPKLGETDFTTGRVWYMSESVPREEVAKLKPLFETETTPVVRLRAYILAAGTIHLTNDSDTNAA